MYWLIDQSISISFCIKSDVLTFCFCGGRQQSLLFKIITAASVWSVKFHLNNILCSCETKHVHHESQRCAWRKPNDQFYFVGFSQMKTFVFLSRIQSSCHSRNNNQHKVVSVKSAVMLDGNYRPNDWIHLRHGLCCKVMPLKHDGFISGAGGLAVLNYNFLSGEVKKVTELRNERSNRERGIWTLITHCQQHQQESGIRPAGHLTTLWDNW